MDPTSKIRDMFQSIQNVTTNKELSIDNQKKAIGLICRETLGHAKSVTDLFRGGFDKVTVKLITQAAKATAKNISSMKDIMVANEVSTLALDAIHSVARLFGEKGLTKASQSLKTGFTNLVIKNAIASANESKKKIYASENMREVMDIYKDADMELSSLDENESIQRARQDLQNSIPIKIWLVGAKEAKEKLLATEDPNEANKIYHSALSGTLIMETTNIDDLSILKNMENQLDEARPTKRATAKITDAKLSNNPLEELQEAEKNLDVMIAKSTDEGDLNMLLDAKRNLEELKQAMLIVQEVLEHPTKESIGEARKVVEASMEGKTPIDVALLRKLDYLMKVAELEPQIFENIHHLMGPKFDLTNELVGALDWFFKNSQMVDTFDEFVKHCQQAKEINREIAQADDGRIIDFDAKYVRDAGDLNGKLLTAIFQNEENREALLGFLNELFDRFVAMNTQVHTDGILLPFAVEGSGIRKLKSIQRHAKERALQLKEALAKGDVAKQRLLEKLEGYLSVSHFGWVKAEWVGNERIMSFLSRSASLEDPPKVARAVLDLSFLEDERRVDALKVVLELNNQMRHMPVWLKDGFLKTKAGGTPDFLNENEVTRDDIRIIGQEISDGNRIYKYEFEGSTKTVKVPLGTDDPHLISVLVNIPKSPQVMEGVKQWLERERGPEKASLEALYNEIDFLDPIRADINEIAGLKPEEKVQYLATAVKFAYNEQLALKYPPIAETLIGASWMSPSQHSEIVRNGVVFSHKLNNDMFLAFSSVDE